MKIYLVTTIASIVFAFSSLAQPSQGDYVIGGSLGLTLKNTDVNIGKVQETSFYVAPSFGKFLSEKYLLHGDLGYSFAYSYNSNKPVNGYLKSISQGVNAKFGLTRFFPISEKFFFTLDAFIASEYMLYNAEESKLGIESIHKSENIAGILGVTPGLAYFINKNWILNASMGSLEYRVSSVGNITHSVDLNFLSSGLNFGVKYIINGKATND